MASLNSLQTRALAAQVTGIKVAEDQPVAFRITHIGAGPVTSVAVTTGTSCVLTDGVENVTVAFATYTTVGAAVDKINASVNWRAKVLDSLRTQSTTGSNTLVNNAGLTANSKYGEYGYDVLLDTTVSFKFPIRCTFDRSAGNLAPRGGHRVKLVSFEYVMNVGAAAADKVRIYEWDPVLKTETQIFSAPSVDSTSTVTSFDFSKAPITAKDGNDLIVMVTDATAITDATTNYVQTLYVRE